MNTTELYPLILNEVTLIFIHGHRDTRKQKLPYQLSYKVLNEFECNLDHFRDLSVYLISYVTLFNQSSRERTPLNMT